jgi:hypothetical protein
MGIPPIPRCLPPWHNHVAAIPNLTISSGCPPVNGFTRCDVNKMRAAAQDKMVALGFWPAGKPMSQATYTLARTITSEYGSGSPEDLVAIGVAYKDAALSGRLLTVGPNGAPAYGPIYSSDPVLCAAAGKPIVPPKTVCAPFNRFAATTQDPTARSLVVADMVLSGAVGNFAEGASDQHGPNAGVAQYGKDWVIRNIPRKAKNGDYWIGPWPGVDWFETFIYMHRPDIAPDSPDGQFLQQRAINALQPMLTKTRPHAKWNDVLPCDGPLLTAGFPFPWWVAVVGVAGYGAWRLYKRHKS